MRQVNQRRIGEVRSEERDKERRMKGENDKREEETGKKKGEQQVTWQE